MSTITPIADSSAAQPDLSGTVNATVSESPKADKKTRRKTSHLKLVPETKELRTSLRDKCREVAARLNKDLPPTKDELEQIARRTLEEAGLPEGYLGWAMVILSSEFFRDSVASIPP